MVLGLRGKNRSGPSVKVDYLIHVKDIKPWPPTQSLKIVRSILIQWDNGDRNSGSTIAVDPSISDGKIEFNESFRLPVLLLRDMSIKNGDTEVFHKNLLEFNLYEPRRDKTVKGQLLGTAIIDLADYGVITEATNITVPVNCTRSFRNTAQPVLYLKIQPYDKVRSSSTLRGKLEKESSLDKNGVDSVSALMGEEYADEAEVASLTDDDISSHSSLTASSALEANGASPSQNRENGTDRGKYPPGLGTENQDHKKSNLRVERDQNDNVKDGFSHDISAEGSSSPVCATNAAASPSDTSKLKFQTNSEYASASGSKPLMPFYAHGSGQQIEKEAANPKGRADSKSISEEGSASKEVPVDVSENENSENDAQPVPRRKNFSEVAVSANLDDVEADDRKKHEQSEQEQKMLEEKRHLIGYEGYESSRRFSQDDVSKQVLTDSPLGRDRPRQVKSVRSLMDSARGNGLADGGVKTSLKHEAKVYPAEKGSASPYTKAQVLEQRLKMLEGELIEAAGIEVALYSVVAEHGSSISKVHAPARRLSRLYFQAKEGMRRASTAQSAVSGLVVVAKACGNDVPRLTFWLSNCVMLRAIVSEAFEEDHLPVFAGPSVERMGNKKGMNKKPVALNWKVSSSGKIRNRSGLVKSLEVWEDPLTLLRALEKVEFWIFSRIVESVWWQTLTPHMQSSAAKVIDKILDSGGRRNYRRTSSSCDQEQVNLSLELWKKAFKDACERLCPLQAGGHECGCLPVLAKLIMEQCVARLDVAMFNAILRESADEIPTDPVSDPISDAKVLPIPAGKSSFGAGAQLKNAIGNWSRWLTDLFGMDEDDAPEDEIDDDDRENHKNDSSFKSFYLLKSLSDLMMLPKDMLLSESIRKEVCPAFDSQLIKRVLENFAPDEFCPDPIPDALFEALDSEDALGGGGEGEGSIMNFPCAAPAVVYSPPPASSLGGIMAGNVGTGSQSHLRRSGSVLRRSNTSDDELDELDSPLNSILGDSLQALPVERRSKQNAIQDLGRGVVRYHLLRQIWGNDIEL